MDLPLGSGKPDALGIVRQVVLVYGTGGAPLEHGHRDLKLRLYDIDRVVSRTLSYAVVTGLVVGLYVAVISLTTKILGFHTPDRRRRLDFGSRRPFQPAPDTGSAGRRSPLQPRRYHPEATVAAFTARLRDAVDLETVRSELLEVVNRVVEPAHASVWIRRRQ